MWVTRCRANESFVSIGGYVYDRLPALQCRANRLAFAEGTAYTSITFTGQRPEHFFPGPASTRPATGSDDEDAFPMHSTWNLYYELESGAPEADLVAQEQAEMLITNVDASITNSRCNA